MLYLHVGLHKTGTTYFQTDVFPRWTGLQYVRNLSVEGFLKLKSNATNLASREGFSGGVIAGREEKLGFLKRLSNMFPEARVLISFRTHASYLNAIYSQYLRYGGTQPLSGFFDLEGDSGVIKRDDLVFRAYVEGIHQYWGRAPFVFLLSEVSEDRARLMSELGAFFGCPPPASDLISRKRRNVSLGRPQAEMLRRINQWTGVTLHRDGSTRPYRLLRRFNIDPPTLCTLWAGLASNPPIVGSELARRVDDYYMEDWAFVKRCVADRQMLSAA